MKYIVVSALVVFTFSNECIAFFGFGNKKVELEPIPDSSQGLSKVRGVPDSLNEKYSSENNFVCGDGKILPFSSVNDNYCDCADGSDEIGTSACSGGEFYCVNKGYKSTKIPSSRVNDGICDCCDATDEAPGVCENICASVFAEEMMRIKNMKLAYTSGSALRIASEEKMRRDLEAKATPLSVLQTEVDALTESVDHVRTQKNEQKNRLESMLAEAKDNALKEIKKLIGIDTLSFPEVINILSSMYSHLQLSENDVKSIYNEVFPGRGSSEPNPPKINRPDVHDDDVNPEDMVDGYSQDDDAYNDSRPDSPEEIVEMGSDGEINQVVSSEDDNIKAVQLEHCSLLGMPAEHLNDPKVAMMCFSNSAHDDALSMLLEGFVMKRKGIDHLEAIVVGGQVKELSKRLNENLDIQDKSFEDFAVNTEDLKTYKWLETTLTTKEENLTELKSKKNAAQDAFDILDTHGEHLAFFSLKDQCFDVADGKFKYSLCMMDKLTQKEIDNEHSSVELGHFSSIEADTAKGIYVIKFDKGQHCWNFGDRTAEVRAVCSSKNALTSATEPSTCFYSFDFETPAACTPVFAQANGIAV